VKSVIITFVIAFLVFEFIEHVAFPLIWFIKNRNMKSNYGVAGMIGKVVEIKRWDETEGQVLINNELWKAVCEVPLLNGGKAVVQGIEGLTLKLKPYETIEKV
jgi:membrane-bound ClpP family serine protease